MTMEKNIIQHKVYDKTGKDFCFTAETLEKVNALIKRYPEGHQKSALLPILHIAQEESTGYLSVETMDYIAGLLGIQAIEVYEVATFYTQYYLEQTGRYVIEVCQTGPCVACGAEDLIAYLEEKLNIHLGETSADGLFTLKGVECLGSCGTAPVMQINTLFYEKLSKEKIDQIINELRSNAAKDINSEDQWAVKFCSNI